MANETKHFYEFGPYRIDPEERLLFRGSEPIPLPPKAFETLLINRSERVVLKDDLMKSLWPDSFVEEANISQNIFVLRKVLGETAQDARYIVTVPGRGYRFAQKVRLLSDTERPIGCLPDFTPVVWGRPAFVDKLRPTTSVTISLPPTRPRLAAERAG